MIFVLFVFVLCLVPNVAVVSGLSINDCLFVFFSNIQGIFMIVDQILVTSDVAYSSSSFLFTS